VQKTKPTEIKTQEREAPPSDYAFTGSLILPALILIAIAIFLPIIIGIIVSFTNSSAITGFFGTRFTLSNYYELLFFGEIVSDQFWQYTYQTIFFSVVSVVIEFVLGLLFAQILNKKFVGRGLARATLLIPWAIPTVASATIFRYEIFASADNNGLFNGLLQILNLNPVTFFGPDANVLFRLPTLIPYGNIIGDIPITTTMIVAIIIDVWKTTPFITLLILAAIQIVPKDLYKAADIAGANGWQKFRHITWPLIKPGVGIALIFRIMQALRVYDAVVVFDDKTVYSMTVQSVNLWGSGEFALSSAIALILFVLIILFAVFVLLITRRRESKKKEAKAEVGDVYEKEEKIYQIEDYLESTSLGFQTKLKAPSQRKIDWLRRKLYIKRALFYVAVIFMCFFCAFPFIWIIIRSFRDPYITQTGFELIPKYFSAAPYAIIFEASQFTGASFELALLNSLILSSLTVLVVIIIGSLVAYAIGKFDFPGKSLLNSFIFSMNSLPPLIIIIPFFIQTSFISAILPFITLQDNLFTLVLPYAAFNLPLAVFVLIAFFNEIPDELTKAAKVDGASNFQIFRKIILPLTIPGIFTTGILVFIAAWNELLFAQIFLISDSNNTVPLAILRFVFNDLSLTAPWDTGIVLLAATTIATVPLVIVVLIFQRKIISGLTRGAVKG
ncbi:MAG: ABC transporter permease subunit, partial [Candidatus Lokiarchaeota archaeon]|nr:ABC transporter permease subunit [Candidatus Lokiarchaeota archaeon]MBD3202569.1 ABC transporter permease subunit [Candidatus Lokiarchaeota archaeon]